jgi:hypothetical protein
MEDSMCWEIDYQFWAEQRKAQEAARQKQEQRAEVIGQLLSNANKQDEQPDVETTPVKAAAPAK